MTSQRILTRHFGQEGSHTIDFYEKDGGYRAARRALETMSPEEVIEEVKAANLRGRGGAGSLARCSRGR